MTHHQGHHTMSRMTDEELADVTARVTAGKCHECRGSGSGSVGRTKMSGIAFVDCDACEGTGAFSLSTATMFGVLVELRERRAADLTLVDRAMLGAVLDLFKRRLPPNLDPGLVSDMMKLLARLVNGAQP